MSSAPPEFDDPQLRATVRRACAAPAGPELRARIADLVRRETTPETAREVAPVRRPAFLRPLAPSRIVPTAVGTPQLHWPEYRDARDRREELAAELPPFKPMVHVYRRPAARDRRSTADRVGLRATLS